MKQLELPVYLDNHSTTRVDPGVVEAMLPYFGGFYGNAASRHHEFGWRAEAAVENARKHVAGLIGADTKEVYFTSGATESINLAIKGIAEASARKGNHIIAATTEHRAVLDTCARLAKYFRSTDGEQVRVTLLPVDRHGNVSPEDLREAITDRTILVTIMAANNEIGTIARVGEIGTICRERGVLFHTDATQAAGKISVDVRPMNVDLMSFSAHKLYGPKGVGALYIRRASPAIRVMAQMEGGGHERGIRSGTLNVPGIVGFGEAAQIAARAMGEESLRVARLRDHLEQELASNIEDVRVNGDPAGRLPNNSSITFRHARADRVMMEMKDIAVSSGSACSSAEPQPSHVLKAIGLDDDDATCTLRFGLGRFTTPQEIDYAIERVKEAVGSVREKNLHVQPTQ